MKFRYFIVTLFLIFWFITIRQALLGQLGGTFKPKSIDPEYKKLETLISQDKKFSRILWVPVGQRYGYYSELHPAISATVFYDVASSAAVLSKIDQTFLEEASIKYVVVPYDQEKEIFLKDRVFNETEYKETVKQVQGIKWLQQLPQFSRIAVFKNPQAKDHLWLESGQVITYESVNPVTYKVHIDSGKKGDSLIFSERFNKNWYLEVDGQKIFSQPYKTKLNSFYLPKNGETSGKIYFQTQKYTNVGVAISLAALITCIVVLFIAFL